MGGGGGVLPINGLMGMCCWMAFHFHDRIDYNDYIFCIFFFLLELGCKFLGSWGVRKFWLVGFKNGKICGC